LDEAIQIMKNAVKLEVPLKVDVEKGDSWGTAK
jgi:DNA polymerase I-like protein with 3'-5' exonuclease and polymerase domains